LLRTPRSQLLITATFVVINNYAFSIKYSL